MMNIQLPRCPLFLLPNRQQEHISQPWLVFTDACINNYEAAECCWTVKRRQAAQFSVSFLSFLVSLRSPCFEMCSFIAKSNVSLYSMYFIFWNAILMINISSHLFIVRWGRNCLLFIIVRKLKKKKELQKISILQKTKYHLMKFQTGCFLNRPQVATSEKRSQQL